MWIYGEQQTAGDDGRASPRRRWRRSSSTSRCGKSARRWAVNGAAGAVRQGVDSSVVAALLIKAVGKQLVCVHVNHGLLRKGEPEQVVEVFRNRMDANLVYVDASERFLSKLAGVSDPETKRKIIGAEFIRVFEEEARKLSDIEFLAQGTIYPDIIESDGVKAHHNVGGLPEDLKFQLVEPLKMLFKDEVRASAARRSACRTTWSIVSPFPGGSGRALPGRDHPRPAGGRARSRTPSCARNSSKNGLAGKVWQYFTVVPAFRSVGVKDGARTYAPSSCARSIPSTR